MTPPIQKHQRFEEFKTYVREEFINHLPFTLIGVLAGLLFALLFTTVFPMKFTENEFHIAHFIHVFFSGAASAAIFRSYRDTVLKAIPIAFFSSVLLCSVSDVLIPFMGLHLFGYEPHIHICILEFPVFLSAAALAGIGVGLVGIQFFNHCNRSFHLIHLLISITASTLYMLSYISMIDVMAVVSISISLFFALAIPCLVGDMVLPLCFVTIKEEYLHEKVHHH